MNAQLDLQKIRSRLEAYDPIDVLATFGALQLLPQNAERVLRFEVLSLAAAMCGRPAKPRAFLSTKIKQVCNDVGAKDRHLEDPAENAFTDVVTYYGGSYTIFPGIAENPAYNLQVVARALIAPTTKYANPEYPEVASHLLMAVLRLSDGIARRAGLARYEAPQASDGKVFLPPDADLVRLKRAVTWSRAEMEALLDGIPMWVLNALVQADPPPADGSYSHERNPLHAWPIVRRGDTYVVPVPSLLGWATMNRIIGSATAAGEHRTLRDNLGDAAWLAVEGTCTMLGYTPLANAMERQLTIEGVREGFFRFDVDKVAYVLLVSDHLEDYDAAEPAAFVADETRSSLLDARIQLALDYAYSQGGTNSVLILVTKQGFTRSLGLSLARTGSDGEPLMLWMPAADLRTIAILETGNALHVWKFARAANDARRRMRIAAVNPLDEYGFYRDRDFSYYASDEQKPDFISVSTGYITDLRQQALRKVDQHAVPAPERGKVAEVTALQPNVPIYFMTGDLGGPIRRFVEGPFPAWIIPDGGDDATRAILHMFGDALAYWWWQGQEQLAKEFPELSTRSRSDPLYVRVRAAASEGWTDADVALEEVSPPFKLEMDPEDFALNIEFWPSCAATFRGATNEGERRLISQIFQAIAPLESKALSGSQADELAIFIAPPGPKKRILIFETGESQLGHPERLPHPRPLDRADQQRLLDQVGEHLTRRYAVGVLSPEQARALVNDAVDWFFQQLCKLVAQLDPVGLLDILVLYHEGLLTHQILKESTIAAQLACFGEKERERLMEDVHRTNATAVAHRFLIEYVAAQPPTGIRPLSLSVLDELLALSEKIITYGFDSDLLFFELAPAEFGMLPSGRLGRSTSFDDARNAYMRILASRTIEVQASRFAKIWTSSPRTSEPPPAIAELDAACAAEFGLPLTKLSAIFSEIIDATLDVPNGIFDETEINLANRLRAKCGLSESEASTAIEFLSLRPRSDFFKATPYKVREVYPWKFNRAMSYLRRPILIAATPNTSPAKALWGKRHTYKAAHYLGDLIFDGRLQARSPEMTAWLGAQANERGVEFERIVVESLTGLGHEVKPSVKKIRTESGTLRPPGDIDALVVDRKRKRIFLVECKDIAIARTPAEIANEIDRLTQDYPKRRSIMAKHLARLEWAKSNLPQILKWLGETPDHPSWTVLARVVTDEHLFAPNLARLPIPVVALDDVERSGLR